MTIDYESQQFNEIDVAADWIRDLESNNSRLHKELVIEKALMAAKLGSANAQCFLFNCWQAYNPYHVFGVKKVPETVGLVDRPNPWPAFWGLLEALRTRSVTGHSAKTAIDTISQQFDSVEWNGLCRRVIIKDLRCGITEKTLNKVLANTDWHIPTFTCQLATDSTEHPGKMTGIKRLEGKLDGVRVIAIVSKLTVHLYSRNGRLFENFPQIESALEQISNNLRQRLGINDSMLILDGEIVGQNFQALMKQAQRKNDAETADMLYHIFDWMPFKNFTEGHCNAQQHKRTEALESVRGLIESAHPCLKVTDGILVDLDLAQGHNQLNRYFEDAVAAGLEGIMVKSWDAPYECKRSSSWMKLKPVQDYDLTVVGVEEGTGKNAGKAGALVCEGHDQNKFIRVNVGTGLSDAQRNDYWQHQSAVIGQTAVVLADAVTQNQDGTYSLRFPRFKTFRNDK